MKTIVFLFLLAAGLAHAADTDTYSTSYRAGHWTAGIVMIGGVLLGAIKCLLVARRPSASGKAFWSLGLVLLSIAVAMLFGQLMRRPETQASMNPLYQVLGLTVFAAVVTSLVLGILGLIECIKQKDVYTQGKGQAIASLGLSGLFVALFIAGFMSSVRRAGGMRSRGQPPIRLTFTNFNFSLLTPGGPWFEWDLQKINPASKYSMMRTMPSIFLSVVPEVLGPNLPLNADSYGELLRKMIGNRTEQVESRGERHVVRKGMDGLEMESQARISAGEVWYVHRLIVTNGFAYQLALWGEPKDRELIRSEAAKVFEGFALLDPTLIGGSQKPPPPYESATHHFELKLPSGWSPSLAHDMNLPEADYMAMNVNNNGAFVVVPVDLRTDNISDDALITALVGCMDFKYPSDAIVAESRTPHQWGTIFRLECQRPVENQDFDYSLMIVRGSRFAYLLAAWNSSSKTNAAPVREAAFASFRPLEPPAETPPIDRLPLSVRIKQASFWNRVGVFYYQQADFEQSARFFGLAGEHHPQLGLYLANQLEALANLNKDDEALRIIEQRLPAVKAPSPALFARHAGLLDKAGRTEEALKLYARAFETGYRNDATFNEYLILLASDEKLDQALTEVERYVSKGDSLPVRLSQALLLRRKKDFAKSIAVVKAAQTRWPTSQDLTLSLGESFVQSGEHKQAADLVQGLLGTGNDSPNVYYLKGRAEVGLKNYKQAKASFEKALEKAPGNPDIRAWLAQASGFLGEGSNTDIKQPIAAVDIPKEFLEGAISSKPGESGHGAKISRRIVAHNFKAGKPFKTTNYELIHVYDRSGVAEFSTLQFPFDPLGESIYVNSLNVRDTNGHIEATGKLSDYYVLDEAAYLISQRKSLFIPVPSLQPGRDIEVMITRQTLGTVTNFPYREHFFSAAVPISESTLLVLGDVANVRHKSSDSLQPEKIEAGLRWQVSNPPVFRWEPLQPALSEFAPVVRLADAQTTWEKEAAEYHDLLRPRLQIPDSVRQLASNLVLRLTNSEARVASLSRFVQSNLTYKPIEFGRRALVPQSATDIVANRYGDCKDHSLLLLQLAQAAGISGQLALVNSRQPIEIGLPSLDQFDHVIVYLPDVKGLFLDCTDKGSDLLQGVPLGLGNKKAFILDEKKPRFVSIPPSRSLASRIKSDRTLRLTNNADVAVLEKLSFSGPIAGSLRARLHEIEPSSRTRLLQNYVLADGELDELEIGNLDRTDEPLELSLGYLLRRQMQFFDNQLVGHIPCLLERAHLAVEPVTSRATPFQLTIPVQFETHVQFDAPEGYSFAALKAADTRVPEKFARCQTSINSNPRRVELNWKAERQTGNFRPSDYTAFKAALDTAIGELARTVVLSKSER